MPTSTVKTQGTRYSLVAFLILTLFVCAIFFYIRNNKEITLNNQINQFSKLKEDYSQIDSCIVLLYKADNNSRLFAATGDKSYIQKFSSAIVDVSTVLEKVNKNAEKKSSSQSLKILVDQKNLRTNLYFKLRSLMDSLISTSNKIDTSKNRLEFANKELTYQQLKTMVTIDTIRTVPVVKVEKEKKFFGRMADVFKRKNKPVQDSSYQIVKKEVRLDTTLESRIFNNLQLKTMNNYFRNLYATNKLLKKSELQILQINNKIIEELVLLLQNYKQSEMAFANNYKAVVKNNIDKTVNSIDNIYIVIIGLLILLVLAILYNLYKIYKNENELINYSQRASQYALSKSRFLANMSHEIRTPLNSIIGFSEQLTQSNLTQQQGQQLDAIRSSSVMLLDVVNDILDFSKYETGKVSFDKAPFAPYNAIMEVCNSIAIQAHNKNIKLDNELSFKSGIVFNGDSLRLKQVVMNLLSNAIKFTEKGGVKIKADIVSKTKKFALLKVQIIDTGIGISAEDLGMIFDEFAQVYYSSTKLKQKGTGLGLAICKKIVEFQGGQIGVESELGKGATFSFEIPYEISLKQAATKNELSQITYSKLEGKRILLADDNKMNILLAQTVINKYKIATDVAYDGKTAFELFENNGYDLILTDIQMPYMGGVELTRKIRAYNDVKKARITILGVTANVLEEDRKKYIEAGMNDLVLKPFSEKELLEKISLHAN